MYEYLLCVSFITMLGLGSGTMIVLRATVLIIEELKAFRETDTLCIVTDSHKYG